MHGLSCGPLIREDHVRRPDRVVIVLLLCFTWAWLAASRRRHGPWRFQCRRTVAVNSPFLTCLPSGGRWLPRGLSETRSRSSPLSCVSELRARRPFKQARSQSSPLVIGSSGGGEHFASEKALWSWISCFAIRRPGDGDHPWSWRRSRPGRARARCVWWTPLSKVSRVEKHSNPHDAWTLAMARSSGIK